MEATNLLWTAIQIIVTSSHIGLSNSFETHPCSVNHSQLAVDFSQAANCGLHPVLVPIVIPQDDLSIQRLHPSHVFLRRCIGSCAGLRGVLCHPGMTEMVRVPVILEKCEPGSSRLCHQECANIEMETHTSCICGCPLQAEEEPCPLGKFFREEDCSCQCYGQNAKDLCQTSPNRTWEEDTCQCLCQSSTMQVCPEGQVFDFANTCRCVPWSEDLLMADIISLSEEADLAHLSTSLAISWELVIIMLLCCIVFVLSTVTVLLLKRMSLMSHQGYGYNHSNWAGGESGGTGANGRRQSSSPLYQGMKHESPY